MAVGVSLVETLCTAGFPIVWTNLLSSRGVDSAEAAGLFGLYMLVFLVDELLVSGAAVVTMRAMKLQEMHGRVLKLVGGVVMLTLAVCDDRGAHAARGRGGDAGRIRGGGPGGDRDRVHPAPPAGRAGRGAGARGVTSTVTAVA